MCDIVGCDEPAEYYDEHDNKMCQYCVDYEITESGTLPENYEHIDSNSEAEGRYI